MYGCELWNYNSRYINDMVWYGNVLFGIIEYAMPENRFDKKKVQRCPETTHRILLGFSLACSHQMLHIYVTYVTYIM